ncbi:endosialin-like [Pristis pectinata]|uniref:endosialin-like n=1 Tax=Pristis pectinata TaxID=685728 RepID=UPI00223D67EE|nr:endosialin-like [Pristis pectinata]
MIRVSGLLRRERVGCRSEGPGFPWMVPGSREPGAGSRGRESGALGHSLAAASQLLRRGVWERRRDLSLPSALRRALSAAAAAGRPGCGRFGCSCPAFCPRPPAGGEPPAAPSSSGAVCGPDSCYTAHLRRRSFTQAWRACRARGGNLASVKRQDEAELVEELVRALSPGGPGQPLRLWLGLQRQPRQCAPRRPLRGFTWTTGDQDTRFTNWLSPAPEAPGSPCPAARCVALSHGSGPPTDFKWLQGSCGLPADGYLCRHTFRGMCPPLEPGPAGPVSYAAPFGLTSSTLRWVPFGSVATYPCGAPKGAVSLLCQAREGGVGWSREPPYCRGPGTGGWCEGGGPGNSSGLSNGGCGHLCVDSGPYYHCECRPGFQLAPDGRTCLDMDECGLGLCPQLCVNSPGSYTCLCAGGYRLGEGGECQDVDECGLGLCPQLCTNSPGSFQCYCRVGFRLERDGDGEGDGVTSCRDVDECQFEGSCQQMCVNYLGHFDCHCEEGFVLEADGYSCRPAPAWDPFTFPSPSLPAGTLAGLLPGEGVGVTVEVAGEEWRGLPPALGEGGVGLGEGLPGETGPPPARSTGRPVVVEHPLPQSTGRPKEMGHSPAQSTGRPMETGQSLPQSTGRPKETGPFPAQSTGRPKETGPFPAQSTGRPKETGPFPAQSTGRPKETGPFPAQSTGRPKETGLFPAQSTGRPKETGPFPAQSTGRPKKTGPFPAQSTGRPKELGQPPARSTGPPVETGPLPALNSSRPAETPTPARGSDGEGDRPENVASNGPNDSRDDRWLLIALLVPICIFGVVMLALGIVYCTRCVCGRRSVTDCYRWVHRSSKDPNPITGSTNVHSTVSTSDPLGTTPTATTWHADISCV